MPSDQEVPRPAAAEQVHLRVATLRRTKGRLAFQRAWGELQMRAEAASCSGCSSPRRHAPSESWLWKWKPSAAP